MKTSRDTHTHTFCPRKDWAVTCEEKCPITSWFQTFFFLSLLPSCQHTEPSSFPDSAWSSPMLHTPSQTHTALPSFFLRHPLPSILSAPSGLPSPVGNPVQCDCGCPSWKLWWWLWLLYSEARIVPASLCVSVFVCCLHASVCVCTHAPSANIPPPYCPSDRRPASHESHAATAVQSWRQPWRLALHTYTHIRDVCALNTT